MYTPPESPATMELAVAPIRRLAPRASMPEKPFLRHFGFHRRPATSRRPRGPRLSATSRRSASGAGSPHFTGEDNLDALLQVLPSDLHDDLMGEPGRSQLVEVILDLGRLPEARYQGEIGGKYLRPTEVTMKDLEHALDAVGEFIDNRAGMAGTLHRISAIKNREGAVVGLTCRVGRAVIGHGDMVYDLLRYGKSILFVGRPGVGKTTAMRDIARVLSDELCKRVVIVDTSNEIGGYGDVPHAAIGRARRLQVPEPSLQHKVMIEAVENHMPEVIIVDEISTRAEAFACQSIAERGVMLIGTAHGETLKNMLKNPNLSDLVGGVRAVTLGDDEARLRRSRKIVLERKAPPTFPFVVEMRNRCYWVMHRTEKSVDMLLNGKLPLVELYSSEAPWFFRSGSEMTSSRL
ncbi:uncharacterized protein ycf45 isoform X2 [Eucalyptus grandis]|uniref:uncharacterized protein ycf45 isoform X2 n=1 Tax=Eucalyptus grandis TaxID=71139 RepID=UPI00192EABD3|nr:uncharacterized protein ycf45 isoform X2 [Eucalyptus grandis]